jgi:alkylation response protein AidB-like acyl-CoA dehydrogenase
MNFQFSDADEAYRQRFKQWLSENVPVGWNEESVEPDTDHERALFRKAWDSKLYTGGYSGITWPREYGGQGGTLIQHAIYLEESARANSPLTLNHIGRNLVAPVLLHAGSEAQKQRFVPKIVSGEETWCQGFSEPNAGSDLASLRTHAELKGGRFIVNGQKIWTSYAQYAQWCILLVRTDLSLPKHKGLSFLLVKLDTPGITIRPIKRITGHADFCEVFYDNVEIPVENLVGDLNSGWQIAMTTLGLERGPEEALARQVRFQHQFNAMLKAAVSISEAGVPVIHDAALRQQLASSLIEVELMRLNCLRGLSSILRKGESGPEASFTKLYWSHMSQRMAETALDIEGPLASLASGDSEAISGGAFQTEYLMSRATTIYSGTSEVQRNIIAERVLGLPR